MPSSNEPGLTALVLRLCKSIEKGASAIRSQTKALDRLAASNEELVDALMQADGDGDPDDGAPKVDLAGRPLQ